MLKLCFEALFKSLGLVEMTCFHPVVWPGEGDYPMNVNLFWADDSGSG